MSENTKACLIVVAIVVGILAVVATPIVWVAVSECRAQTQPLYCEGEIVTSRLAGQKGQIVTRIWWGDHWKYDVRFAGPETVTDTHLLAPDGPIKHRGFQVVRMREYEIKKAEQAE